jgi:rhodanese-related sulfurtransferase
VVQALEARGYDATNVDGGTGEWAAAGFPISH